MAITYNPDTGLQADLASTVRENVTALFKAAFATDPSLPELNTDPETPAGQLIDGMTALLVEKDNEILYLANQINPRTADGVWQDALAAIYFLNRVIKAATTVTCKCTGLKGTVIPYGAVVQDVSGNQLINTFASSIGDDGTVETVFRCVEYGAIEIAAGEVNKIVTVIAGWDTVTNTAAGVTGNDAESQASLENRREEAVAKNAHGTGDAVLGTVLALENVITAALLQNRTCNTVTQYGVELEPHSIYLSVYGGDGGEIAETLFLKLDAGCGTNGNTTVSHVDSHGTIHEFKIGIPETVDMGLDIRIGSAESLPLDYEEKIRAAVIENFDGQRDYSRVQMCETLYASRFYSDIISAGVDNLESVKLVYPLDGDETDFIDIPADKLPVLASENINITVSS